jgi:hypothetical protein
VAFGCAGPARGDVTAAGKNANMSLVALLGVDTYRSGGDRGVRGNDRVDDGLRGVEVRSCETCEGGPGTDANGGHVPSGARSTTCTGHTAKVETDRIKGGCRDGRIGDAAAAGGSAVDAAADAGSIRNENVSTRSDHKAAAAF